MASFGQAGVKALAVCRIPSEAPTNSDQWKCYPIESEGEPDAPLLRNARIMPELCLRLILSYFLAVQFVIMSQPISQYICHQKNAPNTRT